MLTQIPVLAECLLDQHNTDACLIWPWGLTGGGYGMLRLGRRTMLAHRWAWERAHGPIPEGLQLDHLCRQRACYNPAHLEAVTGRINVRRSPIHPAAINARKTHCIHGHEFTPENTYPRRGVLRDCRACHTIRTRARRERNT